MVDRRKFPFALPIVPILIEPCFAAFERLFRCFIHHALRGFHVTAFHSVIVFLVTLGKLHAAPRFNLPRRLREILLRVRGNDELALALYVVEIPADLGDVIRGLPVVLPAGGCLPAFAAAVTLVHSKIRRAAVADALCHFEDHVRARVRLADHIEHVCARCRVRPAAVLQVAQRRCVLIHAAVIRVKDHILRAALREVIRHEVEAAAAHVNVGLAKLRVLVLEQASDLLDGRFRRCDLLRDDIIALAVGMLRTISLVFAENGRKWCSFDVDFSSSVGYTTYITAAEKFHGRVDAHGSKNRSGSFFIRK